MAERREVRVHVGKRGYRMQTELDEKTIDRVVSIVNEVCTAIDGEVEQDSLLLLTCLHLAYNIEKISVFLESMNKRLSDLSQPEQSSCDSGAVIKIEAAED